MNIEFVLCARTCEPCDANGCGVDKSVVSDLRTPHACDGKTVCVVYASCSGDHVFVCVFRVLTHLRERVHG